MTSSDLLCRALAHRVSDLRDRFMVEQRRHSRRAEVHSYAATKDQCFGVIDFNARPAGQFNHEGPKANPLLKRADGSFEVSSGHAPIVVEQLASTRPAFLIKLPILAELLAVDFQIAALAQVHHHVPMQAALVGVAGFRVAGA